MGLFDFGKKAQPKQEPVAEPYVAEQTNGLTSQDCRACTNGHGDGICEYHANGFRRSGQRLHHVSTNRPRYR